MRRGVVLGLALAVLLRIVARRWLLRWWCYDGRGRQGEQVRYW